MFSSIILNSILVKLNLKPFIFSSLLTSLNPNSQYKNSISLENKKQIVDDLINKNTSQSQRDNALKNNSTSTNFFPGHKFGRKKRKKRKINRKSRRGMLKALNLLASVKTNIIELPDDAIIIGEGESNRAYKWTTHDGKMLVARVMINDSLSDEEVEITKLISPKFIKVGRMPINDKRHRFNRLILSEGYEDSLQKILSSPRLEIDYKFITNCARLVVDLLKKLLD